MFTDEYFMKEALKEAKIAFKKDEVPVGAVVVASEKIIARAHNLTDTLNDATAHAEMLAITSAENYISGKYLNDCTLYVSLEPCVMCAGAMNWCQLGRLVYAAFDPKRGYSTVQPSVLHIATKVKSGVLEEESSSLLKEFFKNIRYTF